MSADPLEGCPEMATWPELRHFVDAMRETGKYGGLISKFSKIETGDESDARLHYWRGMLQGIWLAHFSRTERTAVYRNYISLRLER